MSNERLIRNGSWGSSLGFGGSDTRSSQEYSESERGLEPYENVVQEVSDENLPFDVEGPYMDGNPSPSRRHGTGLNHPRSSSRRPRMSVRRYDEPNSPHNVVQTPERARQPDNRRTDPTLSMLRDMLSHMQQQNQATTRAHRGATTPPDFLKSVLMMQTLKTNSFKGDVDTFKAHAWLQNLEKNFAAIRCVEEYKKDIVVYYLEEDATNWWSTVERQHQVTSWSEFRREFEKKYFPPEARDRLELEFLALKQGERSVRDYEAEFTRLRRYVFSGHDDEPTMVRKFLRGLRPDICSILLAVGHTDLQELIEKAVNIEESLAVEKKVVFQGQESGNNDLRADQSQKQFNSTSQGQSTGRGRGRGNRGGRTGATPDSGYVCYSCGEAGHRVRECPNRRQKQPYALTNVVCFKCGEKGHYANTCPTSHPMVAAMRVAQPLVTQEIEEPPAQRPCITGRVYQLGLSSTKLLGSSKDPTTDKYGF